MQLALFFDHAVDLLADALGREARVHFGSDRCSYETVHPAGSVRCRPDGRTRHGAYPRPDRSWDNTLVTVTARHLVTRLDATLDGQINLDDLRYARRQIIALDDLATFVLEFLVELGLQLNVLFSDLLQLDLLGFIFDGQLLKPLERSSLFRRSSL